MFSFSHSSHHLLALSSSLLPHQPSLLRLTWPINRLLHRPCDPTLSSIELTPYSPILRERASNLLSYLPDGAVRYTTTSVFPAQTRKRNRNKLTVELLANCTSGGEGGGIL